MYWFIHVLQMFEIRKCSTMIEVWEQGYKEFSAVISTWQLHVFMGQQPVPPSVPNTSSRENTVCHFKLTKHAEE